MTAELPRLGPWLSRPRPRADAALQLVVFPYAGGGALAFRGWAERLPALEIVLVHLPGRESRIREPAATGIDALVPPLVVSLEATLDRPAFLFGHSMGALIAFEVARHLASPARERLRRLVVAGCRGPRLPDRNELRSVPDARLIEELRRYGATPEILLEDAGFVAMLLGLMRADLTLAETYSYVPGPALEVPILAFGGQADHSVCEEELLGWRGETRAGFRLEMLEGGHFFPFDAPGFPDRLFSALIGG